MKFQIYMPKADRYRAIGEWMAEHFGWKLVRWNHQLECLEVEL